MKFPYLNFEKFSDIEFWNSHLKRFDFLSHFCYFPRREVIFFLNTQRFFLIGILCLLFQRFFFLSNWISYVFFCRVGAWGTYQGVGILYIIHPSNNPTPPHTQFSKTPRGKICNEKKKSPSWRNLQPFTLKE